MITCTPEKVKERFGALFCGRFLVMVDERAGMAEIIEQCTARGPVEWDAANRLRAGGATLSCRVEGSTLMLRAKLGRYPVRFGAASKDIGGQALEGVEVKDGQVITSWAGIAGAGVGVAACLPQSPGVIRAEYPDEEDLSVGGARTNRVKIISPLHEKVTIGIDDTDTREQGATWVTALNCGKGCSIPGVEFLDMRLVQLNPEAPQKTTNCVSSALNFAVRPEAVDDLLSYVKKYVEERTFSTDTGIAVYRGIGIPDTEFARRVKTDLLTLNEAEDEAGRLGITFIDDFRRKGRIGAMGAVLWANRGIEAAGLYGESF